jgi:hypothetical protein
MWGFALRGEALRFHLICASCREKIISEYGVNGARFASSRASPGPRRAFTPEFGSPRAAERKNEKWKLPRSERVHELAPNLVAQTGSNSTCVLEGESARGHGHSNDLELRKKTALYKIFQNGQPEQVMRAMVRPRYHMIVGSLPASAFVSAFLLLTPEYFIEPWRTIHRPLHPITVELKGIKALETIFSEFAQGLSTIVQVRRSAGRNLGLAEYTHLLRCAASMGDAPMADIVWEEMKADKVLPDVRCYNYYLETKIWDKAYTGLEKDRLRVSPFYYRKRGFMAPPPGFDGFGTAGRSVRRQVLLLFREMTDRGIEGDEKSFVNMFLASARVGHGRGMKAILKTVWNIDVDLLAETEGESRHPAVASYDRLSPLYPSSQLLLAVAHGFGTNYDMAVALRTVDFISRQYNIDVSDKVWMELFGLSYVHSKKRFGPDRRRDAKGQVPKDLAVGIFELMTSAPYNVRPGMDVYRSLSRTAYDRDRLFDFQSYMNAAYDLLRETRQKRKEARWVVEQYLGDPFRSQLPVPRAILDALESAAFVDAVNRYEILRLQVAQQTVLMERMARLLLTNNRWTGRENPDWERRLLPMAFGEWRDFLPRSFVYDLRGQNGGRVVIRGWTHWGQPYIQGHDKVPVRWTPDGERTAHDEDIEVDDDFLWDRFRQSLGKAYARREPLRRLFWNVSKRTILPADEMTLQEAHSAEELLSEKGIPLYSATSQDGVVLRLLPDMPSDLLAIA